MLVDKVTTLVENIIKQKAKGTRPPSERLHLTTLDYA